MTGNSRYKGVFFVKDNTGQLSERKKLILKAKIEAHIEHGEPVGSNYLMKNKGINYSSATIRNEMADLEEMGFLEQPHTSAGRIPSDKAYRLYVDTIMNRAQISRDEIKRIRNHFSSKISEVDEILKQTAVAISSVTNYTAMVLAPELDCDTLRHIQLVPLVPGKALLVIVTGTGFAKDAVVHVPPSVRSEELEQISKFLTKRLYGTRMDMVADRITSELEAEMADRKVFLSNIADGIERKISPNRKSVELAGAGNMLHYPEYADLQKARNFLSAVEGRDALYNMLKRASSLEFTITIGSENEQDELKDCSVVTATYRMGDQNMPMGTLGVIGPTRMNYGKVISVLEYMRRSLGEILSNYIEED